VPTVCNTGSGMPVRLTETESNTIGLIIIIIFIIKIVLGAHTQNIKKTEIWGKD